MKRRLSQAPTRSSWLSWFTIGTFAALVVACHAAAPKETLPAADAAITADAGVGTPDASVVDAAVEAPGADAATADSSSTTVVSGTDCAAACANLVKLHCPEGHPKSGKTCVDVCSHAQSSHITDLHPACLAAAKTVAEVRACKSVSCPALAPAHP